MFGHQVEHLDQHNHSENAKWYDLLQRIEKIERALTVNEDAFKVLRTEVNAKLNSLQESARLHDQSISRLQKLLTNIDDRINALTNALEEGNILLQPRNCGINDHIIRNSYEYRRENVKEQKIEDYDADKEDNDGCEVSGEEQVSSFTDTDKDGKCLHNEASVNKRHIHWDCEPNEINNDRIEVKINNVEGHSRQRAKLHLDEYGFKRLKTILEYDNRILIYQGLADQPEILRESAKVSENEANIKGRGKCENASLAQRPDNEYSYSPTNRSDLVSNDQYGCFQDVTNERQTWTALSNTEAEQGRRSRCERGKGPETCILLDISESMSGRSFVQLIEAAKTIIKGIALVAQYTPIQENIAIAVYGHETRVLQHLTNNYSSIIDLLDFITTGGHSPIAAGLLMGLAGCIGNSRGTGTLTSGYRLFPRIILVTNGMSTTNTSTHSHKRTTLHTRPDLIRSFIGSVCLGLSKGRIKVFWVPVGESLESEFPNLIISLTGGQRIHINELDRIIQATRMKFVASDVLLQCPDIRSHVSVDILKMIASTNNITVPCYEDLKLMIEESQQVSDDDTNDSAHEECDSSMPVIGTRVRRGPSWHYADQDGGGPGTVIGHTDHGSLWVEWDNGHKNNYRYNILHNDVTIVNEARKLLPDQKIATGCQVRRGRDWVNGDEDGGQGNIGVVFTVHKYGRVGVRWPNKNLCFHKYGCDGKYEVDILSVDDGKTTKETLNGSSPRIPRTSTSLDFDDEVLQSLNKRNYERIREREECLNGVWEFEEREDMWTKYPEDIRQNLEKAYRRNRDGTTIIQLNEELYRLHFSTMMQIHQRTKDRTRVRRLDLSDQKNEEPCSV